MLSPSTDGMEPDASEEKTTMATTTEMQTISHRAMNDEARRMMTEGVTLTHAQADEIGDEGCGWLRSRLGLVGESTDAGIEYRPEEE